MLKNKKVLVTGAGGFIGSHLVERLLADGNAVGGCQLGNIDRINSNSGELGFFVGKPFWGRGYATEGSRLLLAYAFGELGLASVRSACLAWNAAAVRVLKKLGFELTHDGPPPRGSKFPETERFQYWILTSEAWKSALK
jgi:ribosomal-protein-alanine N-acetyltransferase